MYALLAICLALSPTKVDESIASTMREKYGEQYGKMVRGGEASLAIFEELFTYASPKYLSLSAPPYDQPDLLPKYTAASSPSENPSAHHLTLFVADIKAQLAAPTLRSFLRLYASLGTDKLAGFMGAEEEEVVESLMVLKGLMKSVRRTEGEGGLLEGREVLLGDLDFALDNVRRRWSARGKLEADRAVWLMAHRTLSRSQRPSPADGSTSTTSDTARSCATCTTKSGGLRSRARSRAGASTRPGRRRRLRRVKTRRRPRRRDPRSRSRRLPRQGRRRVTPRARKCGEERGGALRRRRVDTLDCIMHCTRSAGSRGKDQGESRVVKSTPRRA